MARTASYYRLVSQFGGLQACQTPSRERNPRSAGEAHAPQAPRRLQNDTTHLHRQAPVPAGAFLAESMMKKLRASSALIASSFFSPAQKVVNRTPIGRAWRLWTLFRAIMEQGR